MAIEKVLLMGAILTTTVFVGIVILDSEDIIDLPDYWDIESVCLSSHTSEITHYHVNVEIIIDGDDYLIANNIGIEDSDCPGGMRGIHTHDDTGKLHIETPSDMDATLGSFFNIWGENFDEDEILGNHGNSDYEIVMYVNGKLNSEYEQYSMQNNDDIEIRYQQK
ncbi:MAG: hypothetical protein CXT72_02040 [Methanobacteriota archaeon]|jgi:hypothetical protein|nr:MAG: hypothetical protein CXT72_02040 [Euryarchaeota archaeon]HIE64196.1 hypothetical protein [Candidatus Poseidoniales archaeon]HIK99634.1 hypothetical protein [Candidatus Poseidoniales archaeon]